MTAIRSFALAALLLESLAAGSDRVPPVVAHTGAYVRSVTAVITDAKGKPLAAAPALDDLEVFEDGVAAKLLEIEAVSPPAAPPARRAEPTSPPARATPPEARRVPQTLYFDTALLKPFSVRRVCDAVRAALPRLVAAGPLEIVVADSSPRLVQGATQDVAVLDRALARIGAEVKGRDLVGALRREVQDERRAQATRTSYGTTDRGGRVSTPPPNIDGASGADPSNRGEFSMAVSQFMTQEIVLVTDSLKRLEAWSLSRPEISFGILWLASDGFDVEQALFYSPKERALSRAAGADRLPQLVKECADALLRRGWITMPVGFGATVDVPTARTAEDSSLIAHPRLDPLPGESETGTPLFVRPVEPLRTLAETTGGEVVTTPDGITPAGLAKAWVLTYQTRTPRDGRSHALAVKSRRRAIVVHTAESIAAGTPESVAATRAARVLAGEEAGTELAVAAAFESVEPMSGGMKKGRLATRVSLAPLKELLARLGGGRLRITLLVAVEGKEALPYHEEVRVPATGFAENWTLRSSLTWPPEATKAAVVVEELGTGMWGSASTPLVPGALPAVAVVAAAPMPAASAASAPEPEPETGRSRSMEILTFASGLVTGTITVKADLGMALEAELLLDGHPACTMTPNERSCPVVLGSALAVHRLELVRRAKDGAVLERATRWLNRPGSSDAEVRSRITCDEGSPCLARFSWVHPDGLDPEKWDVSLDGASVSKKPEKGFTLMVPNDGKTHVVSADASFADGAAASLVRVLGAERSERAGDVLQSVPVLVSGKEPDTAALSQALRASVRVVERGEARTVVVLDPVASMHVTEQRNEALGGSFPGVATSKLKGALNALGALRVVHPEANGQRFPVAEAGSGEERLELLTRGPLATAPGAYRIADAVAAAGVLAAGSHGRRALVLLLGDERPDKSHFSVEDARAYLAELMVPLVVLRFGEGPEGPWGPVKTVRSQAELTKALDEVGAALERQRVAWIAGERPPAEISLTDPSGQMRLAGR